MAGKCGRAGHQREEGGILIKRNLLRGYVGVGMEFKNWTRGKLLICIPGKWKKANCSPPFRKRAIEGNREKTRGSLKKGVVLEGMNKQKEANFADPTKGVRIG